MLLQKQLRLIQSGKRYRLSGKRSPPARQSGTGIRSPGRQLNARRSRSGNQPEVERIRTKACVNSNRPVVWNMSLAEFMRTWFRPSCLAV